MNPDHFPVEVRLRAGSGVSNSIGGRIELYRIAAGRAPVLHELTHVLAGYTRSNGHWSQEGLASYMQDRHGGNIAYPTFGVAHALVRLLIESGGMLPMETVMKDRDRGLYFGLSTPWARWRAYAQSTSFCTYLIDKYGMKRFLKLYDKPIEAIDFRRVYGRTGQRLLAEWRTMARRHDGGRAAARKIFERMKRTRR